MIRDQDGWIEQYKKAGALWIHDGNPKRHHALLTGGWHSNGFFNSRLIVANEPLLSEASCDLVESFSVAGGSVRIIDRVVGSQTGATKLAEFISNNIDWRRDCPCEWASPAKVWEGKTKRMVFDDEKRRVRPGEIVLLCEDVLTTGESVDLAESAVVDAGGIVLPFILVPVNRSGLAEVGGKRIISLINHPMSAWTPAECPLCTLGSEAIRPKEPAENWRRLNQQY